LERHYKRSEARGAAFDYIQALLSSVERKNGWQMSKQVGSKNPYRFQNLLGRASWNEEKLCAEVRAYTLEHLEDWHTLSCGAGSKGERYSDWARVRLSCTQPKGYSQWFLFRRQFSKDKNRFVFSYYQAFAPKDTSLGTLAWAAASSWRIEREGRWGFLSLSNHAVEECFKFAKSHLGLADYEVRSWTGWHRHTALVLAAGAFLFVLRFQLEEFPDVIDHPLFSPSRKAGSLDAFKRTRGRPQLAHRELSIVCTGLSGVENTKLLLVFFIIANEIKHPNFYLQL